MGVEESDWEAVLMRILRPKPMSSLTAKPETIRALKAMRYMEHRMKDKGEARYWYCICSAGVGYLVRERGKRWLKPLWMVLRVRDRMQRIFGK